MKGTKPQNALRVLDIEVAAKDVSILSENHLTLTDRLVAAGIAGMHGKPSEKKKRG